MSTKKYTPKKAINAEVNEATAAYGPTNDNVFSIIHLIKKGIRFPIFKLIMEKSPFSIAEWSDFLHLSERTMLRYKSENKSFDPIYSEKIMEITMLYNYGTSVFGNEDNFNIWLNTFNVALGGAIPKELLDNTFGIHLIKDELTRIEHGILA